MSITLCKHFAQFDAELYGKKNVNVEHFLSENSI